jgi:hypothetical protein
MKICRRVASTIPRAAPWVFSRESVELENLPLIMILKFEERAISKRIPLAGTLAAVP